MTALGRSGRPAEAPSAGLWNALPSPRSISGTCGSGQRRKLAPILLDQRLEGCDPYLIRLLGRLRARQCLRERQQMVPRFRERPLPFTRLGVDLTFAKFVGTLPNLVFNLQLLETFAGRVV